MTVNGTDIRKYDGVQLSAEVSPPQMAAKTEWIPNSLRPVNFESKPLFGTLSLKVLLEPAMGENAAQMQRKYSRFLACFQPSPVTLFLDGYQDSYLGYLTGNSMRAVAGKRWIEAVLDFQGYFQGRVKTHSFSGRTGRFWADCTRETPCILQLTPTASLSSCTVSGLGEALTVKNLAGNQTVIIDGLKGTVTQAGANKFKDAELWEFPRVRPGWNSFQLSTDQCRLAVQYRPMWI